MIRWKEELMVEKVEICNHDWKITVSKLMEKARVCNKCKELQYSYNDIDGWTEWHKPSKDEPIN